MTKKYDLSKDKISTVFNDTAALTKVIQAGIYAALLQHKQAGNSVCELQKNKVVWIAPEQIPVKVPKK